MNSSARDDFHFNDAIGSNEELAEFILDLVSRLMDELTPQKQDIFCSRILRSEQTSLRVLGERYGKTAERMRIIVKETERQIGSHVESSSYRELKDLLQLLPEHWGSAIPSSGLPSWPKLPVVGSNWVLTSEELLSFISYLTFGKVREHGWFSKFSIEDIEDELIKHADSYGVMRLDPVQVLSNIGIKESFIPSVLSQLNRFVLLLNHWVIKKDAYSEKALQILSLISHPLSNTEIADILQIPGKVRSLTNALQSDSRFTRTGKNKYGLTVWGNDSYEGICVAMEKLLTKHKQMLDIDFISSVLSEQFSISKNSVKAYSFAPIFFHNGTQVRLREPDDPYIVIDDVNDLNWVEVSGDLATLTFSVDRELRRGSGRQLPINLSWRLGLVPGDSKQIEGQFGQLLFAWNIRSHTGGHLGSLKSLSDGLGCSLGDNLVLKINTTTLSYLAQKG